jgi:hypothetical protein
MRDPKYLLFLDLAGAIVAGWDLFRTLKTGREEGKDGTITRAHQPARFRRDVYSSCALLAFLAASFLRVLISPASLRQVCANAPYVDLFLYTRTL